MCFCNFFVIQVRKQLRDMEAKVKDQEEELDEQAGTIQMLEQVQTEHCENIQHNTFITLVLFTNSREKYLSLQPLNAPLQCVHQLILPNFVRLLFGAGKMP